ncbi:unnamed protein product [Staurois parvus]|uniref:Uncharacterized protein n=1 Tax=Staurois parvus TaxID=386267 RepID=A0ABN9G306_9NEOB|nr:unnamed protein product [Staurois parvus]
MLKLLTANLILEVQECQNSTDIPQMTPFCKVDSPTYFVTGMASFLKL